MRIGIDMLAVQSPGSRGRGIGRYGRSLVASLLDRGKDHEFVLYAHDGYPFDKAPECANASIRFLKPDRELGETALRDVMERLARRNPDELDLLLILNPFELCPGYDPPARPLNGLKVAAVVYDLIPFLFPERYLADPPNAAWNHRRLNTLRTYDRLLTISESTRSDCLRMLNLPSDRVSTIGGASESAFFSPDRSFPMPAATRVVLGELGVVRPFVFSLAGVDPRKNVAGLIEAFSQLPCSLRHSHQLVVTCFLREGDGDKLRRFANERGVGEALVLTGEIPDSALRVLYRRCALFAFPSLYEGLGLPILEAMHCGAPVLAGDNSSQVEVVGDAGLLANARDSGDLARRIEELLGDPVEAQALGERGVARAATFTWAATADRALEAIESFSESRTTRRFRLDRGNARPRLAMFSPWPPKGSGISDYAIRLIGELKRHYEIHLFHDSGYVPEIALRTAEFRSHEHRLFPRLDSVLDYRGVIYQMGNSYYHGFIYEMIKRRPGIVALHDFNLAAFQFWRAHQGGVPMDNFRAEIEYCYPERFEEIGPQLWGWTEERGGLQEACSRRNLHMNRRVLAEAKGVVVHSRWCVEEVGRTHPEYLDKMNVVPMGATPRPTTVELRNATRARFGLPPDALLFGSFGILAQGKMNVEAIDAFHELAVELPHALLIFVGQDWENGEARDRTLARGLGDRVRFLGRQGDADFLDLMAAVDIGIALRRPPTYGETSAALLDLLRTGVPTIINDVATFTGYPESVVRKVRWTENGLEGLVAAMRSLAHDEAQRRALGERALAYVRTEHTWSRAAALYADVVERAYDERMRARRLHRDAASARERSHVVGMR
jgi:glycosyltransferase involved in cell wall biosynthesis